MKFYLKGKDGYIYCKFEPKSDEYFEGTAYDCVSWSCPDKKPAEWLFHSEVSCKWDGCSHWWFFGENYNGNYEESADGYYHICSQFESFITTMCFVWRLARDFLRKKHPELREDIDEEFNLKIVDMMLENYEIIQEE